ncbi:hypothetical protein MMC31_005059, partial [Peltigera leucophlebia]|nr:hypothetical protein [Peltigera leucophlebia]
MGDTDSPTGPYLTLSHCWGSALVSKLEMSDIEKSKAGIPASALPKTFRDAAARYKKAWGSVSLDRCVVYNPGLGRRLEARGGNHGQ